MELFTVALRVSKHDRPEEFEAFDIAVDAREMFSRISRAWLARRDVQASRRMQFRTPEGRVMDRDFAPVHLVVEGRTALDNVLLADAGEMEVLGSHSIDGFGLAVDQVQRKLVPTIMLALVIP
ncbi:MAG TPA: hypothetical protein VEO19_05870 [Terriglobia bacterium]|nr:hypothetical protein [Terriglobia bacterium]